MPAEPPLGELITEAWGEFINVDGKVMATLRLLLLHPGELTCRYLSGQRARFMPPLRLYLTATLAFFLINAMVPKKPSAASRALARRAATATLDSVKLRQQPAGSDTLHLNAFSRRLERNATRVSADGHNFTNEFTEQLPKGLFVVMPLFALLLALAYRTRRRRYAAHLIMSMHLHAFAYLVAALAPLVTLIPWSPLRRPLGYAYLLWVLAYIPFGLRRFYGGRWTPTLLRTAALSAAYLVILLGAVAGIGVADIFFY